MNSAPASGSRLAEIAMGVGLVGLAVSQARRVLAAGPVGFAALLVGAGLLAAGAAWLWLRAGGGPRPPRRLRARPSLAWTDRPFLGWTARGRRFLLGSREDSIGIVGPPRVGKTAGLLVGQALLWHGPMVSTSTKPDVLRATAGRRLQLAVGSGGRVEVYAPTYQHPIEGLRPLRWSPLAGCKDPTVCQLRVLAMIDAGGGGGKMEDADHWRAGAASVLRGYFHAAATSGAGMTRVMEWLARQEVLAPMRELREAGTAAGEQWATELEGLLSVGERERGSFYTTARNSLSALANPVVLASCEETDLDVDAFLRGRGSLYIVSPTSHQSSVAPLVAGLIESIVERAYELSSGGLLPAPLLLSLDEVANIAPLRNLSGILSQGASQGVVVSWAVQSLAQLRARYGEEVAQACWSASRARIVFGGLADARDLEDISRLAGEREVRQVSRSTGAGGAGQTSATTWRPALPASELRGQRPGTAHLIYHASEPVPIRVPIAARVRPFRNCPAWSPAQNGLQ